MGKVSTYQKVVLKFVRRVSALNRGHLLLVGSSFALSVALGLSRSPCVCCWHVVNFALLHQFLSVYILAQPVEDLRFQFQIVLSLAFLYKFVTMGRGQKFIILVPS